MSYRECPHGIVAGTCNWCMAEQIERDQVRIEEIRGAVALHEREEARRRFEAEKRKK